MYKITRAYGHLCCNGVTKFKCSQGAGSQITGHCMLGIPESVNSYTFREDTHGREGECNVSKQGGNVSLYACQ